MGRQYPFGDAQLIISLFLMKREEEEREERSNFERSILLNKHPLLRLSFSGEEPQPPAATSPIHQDQDSINQCGQNQSGPPQHPAIKLEDLNIAIPQMDEYFHDPLQSEEGSEAEDEGEGGVILKIKMKKLSPIILSLIRESGAMTKVNLKSLLIQWYETGYGSLNQKTKRSLTRRFYDTLKIFTTVYKTKNLKNERIAPVEDVPSYQRHKLSIYRRKEQTRMAQIQRKSRKLRLARGTAEKMRKLHTRNRRNKAPEKINLPIYAYQQERRESNLLKWQSDRLVIKKVTIDGFQFQNQLLEHLDSI